MNFTCPHVVFKYILLNKNVDQLCDQFQQKCATFIQPSHGSIEIIQWYYLFLINNAMTKENYQGVIYRIHFQCTGEENEKTLWNYEPFTLNLLID